MRERVVAVVAVVPAEAAVVPAVAAVVPAAVAVGVTEVHPMGFVQSLSWRV
jgi:hypothetical protein